MTIGQHSNLLQHTHIVEQMRELYAGRLQTQRNESEKHLKGFLEVTNIKAGLYMAGFLRNGMSSRQAESAAMSHGIETMALDRFMLSGTDPRGITIDSDPAVRSFIHD